VIEPDGAEHSFEIPAFRKFGLLNGLDEIGLTLRHKDTIWDFEQKRLAAHPWLAKAL
ncbi:MAG: 3-isopropylmalate dehydratase small subunit, partial [Burkholderiales bacterium]